jgi:hypothetical protein
VVNGYGQDDQMAVDEAEGYTGDISGAMGFCCWRGNDVCGNKQGSEPLEGCHPLHLDQQGNSHVVWEQNGGIPPWDWPFPQWVFGPSAPWAVPSSDGRHLAIYEWSMSANMWIMENF